MNSKQQHHLILAIVVVGLLVVNGAVWSTRTAPRAEAAGIGSLDRGSPPSTSPLPESLPPPTTTTTTTTVEPPVVVPRHARAVDIPSDPYAAEPIVRIGTIQIPRIGLDHPIYEGITMRNIDLGPSHWPGSALPGERGNAVFSGHRVTHTRPFNRIAELQPGDEVIFTVNGRRSTYRVTGHEVVLPTDTWITRPTDDATATLFACHPPGQKTHRYVVRLALAGS